MTCGIPTWRPLHFLASFIMANNRSVIPTSEEASRIPPLNTLKPTTSIRKPVRPVMSRQRGRTAWVSRITARTASSAPMRTPLNLRRRVRGRRHLVGVIGIQAGGDALFLGQPGELVIVGVLGRAPVLPAIPVESLGKLIRILPRHSASSS